MNKSARTLAARFWKDESGASMVEYVILIALVTVFLIGTIELFSDGIAAKFVEITGIIAGSGT